MHIKSTALIITPNMEGDCRNYGVVHLSNTPSIIFYNQLIPVDQLVPVVQLSLKIEPIPIISVPINSLLIVIITHVCYSADKNTQTTCPPMPSYCRCNRTNMARTSSGSSITDSWAQRTIVSEISCCNVPSDTHTQMEVGVVAVKQI